MQEPEEINTNSFTTVAFTGMWKKSLLALGLVTAFLHTVNLLISTTLPLYSADGNIKDPAQGLTVLHVLPYINLFAMLFVFQFQRNTPVRMFEIKSLKTASTAAGEVANMKTWTLNSFGTAYALISILGSLSLVFLSQTFERCSAENIKVHKTTTEAGLRTGPAELACTYARFANGSNLMDPAQLLNANTMVVLVSAVVAYYTFKSQDKFAAKKAESASAVVQKAGRNIARNVTTRQTQRAAPLQAKNVRVQPKQPQVSQSRRYTEAVERVRQLEKNRQTQSNARRVEQARETNPAYVVCDTR